MRKIILSTSCFLIIMGSFGQTVIVGHGVILAVEDKEVYIDLYETSILVGDRMQVIGPSGFFSHPVAGEQKSVEPDVIKAGTRIGSRETRLADRNAKITFSEYSGVSAINRQAFAVNIDRGKDVGYRNRFSYNVYESMHGQTHEQSLRFIWGRQKIGKIRLNYAEKNMSQGIVTLRKNINRSQEHNFEEAIIEFIKYRRLSITPITLADPLESRGAFQLTMFKLSYRLIGAFSVGFRLKHEVYLRSTESETEMQAWDVFGGLNYRFLRTLEPFINVGFSAVIDSFFYYPNVSDPFDERTNPNFSERIFLEIGIRQFASDWLSLDIHAPVYPFFSIGLGVSFHMF